MFGTRAIKAILVGILWMAFSLMKCQAAGIQTGHGWSVNPSETEAVNEAIKNASEGAMKDILGYTEDPIVSSDIVGDSHSSIFDSLSTMVMADNMLKVVSWYDNEWGYSCRVVDLIRLSCSL